MHPGQVGWSYSYANNYKYLRFQNPNSSAQMIQIRLYMANWQGLSADTWAVVWSKYPQ